MTVNVTKINPVVVSGPGPGVAVTKISAVVVIDTSPRPGVTVTKISAVVVIDTSSTSGRRRQMIVT